MKKKTLEEMRNFVIKDVPHRDFVVYFNMALQEINGKPEGLAVFLTAIVPVLKAYGKINDKTLEETLDMILKMDAEFPFKELNVRSI